MAQNNWNRGGYGGGNRGNYGVNDNRSPRRDSKQIDISPKSLPKTYVDDADEYMQANSRFITTSKLRNILTLFTSAYNRELVASYQNINNQDAKLSPATEKELLAARIRIVYECGREPKSVGNFVRNTNILSYLKGLNGNQAYFLEFYHYLEALVAYHKFHGGKEN